MSICPKCNTVLHCPCKNCKERNEGKALWKWVDGNDIECPECGYKEIADAWEAREVELAIKEGTWPT